MEEQKGQGTLEYALLLALMAVVAIAILSYFGFRLSNVYASMAEVLLSHCEAVTERVYEYSGPLPPGALEGTGEFKWPTEGRITQRAWHCHHAVDIANSEGTPIYAADSGYVVVAGWKPGGYGQVVILNHGHGLQSLYAHLSAISVSVGESVVKGRQIGLMGNTGHSTGSHLHFEIRKGSQLCDPLEFVSPP